MNTQGERITNIKEEYVHDVSSVLELIKRGEEQIKFLAPHQNDSEYLLFCIDKRGIVSITDSDYQEYFYGKKESLNREILENILLNIPYDRKDRVQDTVLRIIQN